MSFCARCLDTTETLFPANCSEHPEKMKGHPISQYHCPDCGTMLIVGYPHPKLCQRCIDRVHPGLDMDIENTNGGLR